jgi:peptide deformylase
MAIRKIAVMGNPVLRQVAKPIPPKEILTPKVQELLQDMVDTMFEYDGRGLAAPQIHESVQALVMIWDFEAEQKPSLLFLINPEIKSLTEETSAFWEGCLSVPGLRGKVARPNRIQVNALNQKGEKVEFIAEGFAATVVQHECDHLLGKLYVDKIEDMKDFSFNREFSRFIAREEDVVEEGEEEESVEEEGGEE